jgi:hypothetical protein
MRAEKGILAGLLEVFGRWLQGCISQFQEFLTVGFLFVQKTGSANARVNRASGRRRRTRKLA